MTILVAGLGGVAVQRVYQGIALLRTHAFYAFHAPGVEVERGAATDRVAYHQRLGGVRDVGHLLGTQLGKAARAVAALMYVQRAQGGDALLQGCRQLVIGAAYIDELRVATA